jgi:hypothetical protein
MPGFAWLDDSIEHSDSDYARAEALAKKITSLRHDDEQRMFRQIADDEEGRSYDPSEDCECDYCIKANHDCNEDNPGNGCSLCAIVTELTECESVRESSKAKLALEAERDLEIELCEDKLESVGARMMRPYEHWNEDERYMEYQENRY